MCQKADAVLYVAESMHDDLKDIFSNQLIACMGNGVDTDFLDLEIKIKKILSSSRKFKMAKFL